MRALIFVAVFVAAAPSWSGGRVKSTLTTKNTIPSWDSREFHPELDVKVEADKLTVTHAEGSCTLRVERSSDTRSTIPKSQKCSARVKKKIEVHEGRGFFAVNISRECTAVAEIEIESGDVQLGSAPKIAIAARLTKLELADPEVECMIARGFIGLAIRNDSSLSIEMTPANGS
jgi:hypothetical protein